MQILLERYLHEIAQVNSTKTNRDVKQGISVCSRIKRLTNNRVSNRKKSDHSHKIRDGDKNAVAMVKIVSQMGCVSQDSELLDSQRSKQARGNPMQKVLGPIRRIQFTQSTLRQASIREKKGTIAWTNRIGYRKTTAMRPKQGMELCQEQIQAARRKKVCGRFRS